MIYESNYKVGINQVGHSNLLTNFSLLSFLEDVGAMHSDLAGYGINDISRTHLSWVLLHWKVHTFIKVAYGAVLTIKTWSHYSSKFFCYRDFEVYDEQNNLVAIASSKWTLINIENKNLEKINDTILSSYQPENKSVFTDIEIQKLKEPENSILTYNYTIQRSNIDINRHMHNLDYLSLAYEALPEDVYYSSEFNNIEIMYKKEAKLR